MEHLFTANTLQHTIEDDLKWDPELGGVETKFDKDMKATLDGYDVDMLDGETPSDFVDGYEFDNQETQVVFDPIQLQNIKNQTDDASDHASVATKGNTSGYDYANSFNPSPNANKRHSDAASIASGDSIQTKVNKILHDPTLMQALHQQINSRPSDSSQKLTQGNNSGVVGPR